MDYEDIYEFDESIDDLLIEEPSVYVKCPACHNVYSNPVVNVKCGHTFCKLCLLKTSPPGSRNVTCPLDGEECLFESLIVNRSIQDQIEGLLVRCKSFNKSDGSGCTDVMKYGKLQEHKNHCAYAYIKCPWKPDVCFQFMRKDLSHHLDNCKFNISENYEVTSEIRLFQKKFDDSSSVAEQIKLLKTSIETLFSKIGDMSQKLNKLEGIHKENEIVQHSEYDEDGYASIDNVLNTGIISLGAFRTPDDFWTMPFQFKCIGTMNCHDCAVSSLAIMDHMVFSSDVKGNVKVWNLDALEKGSQSTIKAGKDKINSVVVYKDHLYAAGDDSLITCCDSKLVEISSVHKAHDESITALLCSKEKLFSASFTNVKVWKCRSLEILHTIKGLHHWARSLAIDVPKRKLYIGAHGTITIWNNSDAFQPQGKITEPIGSVYSLVVTNQFIIAGTYNKNIHVYDINRLTNVHHLKGHLGIINSLVAPKVQQFLISCSSDSTILLWSLENQLLIQAMQRHNAGVTCAAIVDDFLITGSEDMEIKIFKQFKSS